MLILICGIAGRISAQSEAGIAVKSKIAALEELWYEAYKGRDTKAIDSILDNSVLLVNDDGSVQTKGDFLADMKGMFSQPTAPQVTPESFEVRTFGTTVIATGVYRIKGIERGKPYTRRIRFLDTWKYKGGSWLIIGTQATPVLH
jgi:ketosteroid isomerase-like protein